MLLIVKDVWKKLRDFFRAGVLEYAKKVEVVKTIAFQRSILMGTCLSVIYKAANTKVDLFGWAGAH